MKQLVHRTGSAMSAVMHQAAEAYFRWPLTLKSNAIRGRMSEPRQHGAVDCFVQAGTEGFASTFALCRLAWLVHGIVGTRTGRSMIVHKEVCT